jgi:hypothetical protein
VHLVVTSIFPYCAGNLPHHWTQGLLVHHSKFSRRWPRWVIHVGLSLRRLGPLSLQSRLNCCIAAADAVDNPRRQLLPRRRVTDKDHCRISMTIATTLASTIHQFADFLDSQIFAWPALDVFDPRRRYCPINSVWC